MIAMRCTFDITIPKDSDLSFIANIHEQFVKIARQLRGQTILSEDKQTILATVTEADLKDGAISLTTETEKSKDGTERTVAKWISGVAFEMHYTLE